MKRKITAPQRRHQDYLRRKGLAVGKTYMSRLEALRRKELKRVLALCADVSDTAMWAGIVANNLDESGYLYDWHTGLYINAGLPFAQSIRRDLSKSKASGIDGIWESTLRAFAQQRCARNIVSLSGTFRDDLQKIISKILESDMNIGIESLTKKILQQFGKVNEWQARRIAQTETMIGLAESGNIAALSTDVKFTKQWCISGVGNTRESHEAMDGVIVDQNDYFELPDCVMQYPHDISGNAPADEIINCACSCIRAPKDNRASRTPEKTVTAPALTDEERAHEQRVQEKEMPKDMPEGTKKALAENTIALEKEFGIKKGAPMSIEKADRQSANPEWSPYEKSHQINCATCSPAYALRE